MTFLSAGNGKSAHLLNPTGLQFTGPKWVCTPRVERAIALGYQQDPGSLDLAPTWSCTAGLVRAVPRRQRRAGHHDPDAQAARNQAKVIRTHGIGIIGSNEHLKGNAYSPERRLHIVSKANSNIIYRLHQIGERTGEWPLAVATDARPVRLR